MEGLFKDVVAKSSQGVPEEASGFPNGRGLGVVVWPEDDGKYGIEATSWNLICK